MMFTKYLYISFWFKFIVNSRRFSTHTTGWKRVSLMYVFTKKYYISNILGYFYKNQDLFTLPELLDSPPVAHHISFFYFMPSCVLLSFVLCCCFLFCLFFFGFFFLFFVCFIFCLSFFLFPQCGQCLWILYSSLRFRVSLTFVHLWIVQI